LATVLLVECLTREARVQVAQAFGQAVVLSALRAAQEADARDEQARRKRLDMLAGLPDAEDARHEQRMAGVDWLMRQRAEGRLGSAV